MSVMVLSRRRPMLLLLFAAFVAALWMVTPAFAQDTTDTIDPNHGGGDHDNVAAVGLLQSMPEGGGVGEYVVDDTTYTADSDTEFETEHGALAVGACVKVRVEEETPTVAEKIQTLPANSCDGDGNPGDGDGDHDGDRNEVEYYGRIVSMPAEGMVGEWVVGDRTFTADDDTEFKTRRGGFEVGVCVEVEANRSTPTVAEQIETESDYKCNGSDDDGDGRNEWDGRLYGTITALPDDPALLGEWTVGAFTFIVTTTTDLESRDGDFEVGSLIKVDFYVDDGQTIATRIRMLYHHGGPGHGGGHWGRLGHAWGEIEALPADPFVGSWTISGVPYTVTAQTRLKQNAGAFAVGENVKVKYYVADDGGRVAWEIRTTNDTGGISENGCFKFVGFVETAPEGSLIGDWVIGGTSFTATNSTRFKEDDGLLVVGAYVEVEYRIVNGQRVIKELETEAPPGSGDDNTSGVIQQGGEDLNSTTLVAVAAEPGATVWKISGREYVVTTATELNSNDGPLTVGSTVLVNSYTNAQGQRVATRVAGVVFTDFSYLPIGRQ